MVVEGRKALTWGTLAAAVASALLLASSGGGMPRVASIVSDVMRARPASSAPTQASARHGPAHADAPSASPGRGPAH